LGFLTNLSFIEKPMGDTNSARPMTRNQKSLGESDVGKTHPDGEYLIPMVAIANATGVNNTHIPHAISKYDFSILVNLVT